MKATDLLSRLRRLANKRGWVVTEQPGKGSHLKVTVNGKRTVIPMHRGDVKPGTFRSILSDLGLTKDDLEV